MQAGYLDSNSDQYSLKISSLIFLKSDCPGISSTLVELEQVQRKYQKCNIVRVRQDRQCGHVEINLLSCFVTSTLLSSCKTC